MKATSIERRIVEVESGKPLSQTIVIEDAKVAKKKYDDALRSAKDEIFIVDSTGDLSGLQNYVKDLKKEGLSIKIMMPVTNCNLGEALKISEYCEVRHVPPGYQNTVIVDDAHLFQVTKDQENRGDVGSESNFGNTFYTNDPTFLKKTKTMLKDIWNDAQIPSAASLNWINRRSRLPVANTLSTSVNHISIEKQLELPKLTEREILNKIINAKVNIANSDPNIIKTFGTNAQAIVHPPIFLNLPDLLFHLVHKEKNSSFGAEDAVLIHLWLETPTGFAYVPVAFLTDNFIALDFWKKFFTGCPAGQNIQVLGKNELEVRVHGNTLSAIWTKQIPLLNNFSLPPSCIIVEGYGPLYSETYTVLSPSGYKMKTEYNGFDGFVTYLNPSSKYSGPGTDGYFGRDTIMEFYPP
jgi:hypothetical protein